MLLSNKLSGLYSVKPFEDFPVIVSEPLSSSLREAFINCTVITIAHRLNTVMDSGRIIVMDQVLSAGRCPEKSYPEKLV